jgi:hypothetical protein
MTIPVMINSRAISILFSTFSDETLGRRGARNFEIHPFVYKASTRTHETVELRVCSKYS